MLADEPIASLDPLNAKVVMDALRDINRREGITVITNLHTLDTARTYCNRIIGMAAGKVVFDGPPEELDREAVRDVYGADSDGGESPRPSPRPASAAASPKIASIRRTARTAALPGSERPAWIARPRQRHLSKFERTPARRRNQQERHQCSRRCFLARFRCSRWRRVPPTPQDIKEFRVGILGGENEADRLRNYQCLADHLKDDSASRRSRCSRPPTMTASSRACSAARSTSPSSAPPAMPASTSRTRRRSPRSSPPSRPTARPATIRSAWRSKISGIKTIKDAKGKKLGYADPDSTSGYLIPLTQIPKDTGVPNDQFFASTQFNGGHENNVLAVRDGKVDVAVDDSSGIGDFKDGYTSGTFHKEVAKGAVDPNDFVEVWRSRLIPNGPLVVRTALGDDWTAKLTDFFTKLPADRQGLLRRRRRRRLQRLRPGEAGLLQRHHRRPQGSDRRLIGEIEKGGAIDAPPFLHAPTMTDLSVTAADPRRHPRRHPPDGRCLATGRRSSAPALYGSRRRAAACRRCAASLWFADESNAGHFFDRLPHLFDFLSWLIPKDWNDVWRALVRHRRARRSPAARNSTSRSAASMSGAASTSPNISS